MDHLTIREKGDIRQGIWKDEWMRFLLMLLMLLMLLIMMLLLDASDAVVATDVDNDATELKPCVALCTSTACT